MTEHQKKLQRSKHSNICVNAECTHGQPQRKEDGRWACYTCFLCGELMRRIEDKPSDS